MSPYENARLAMIGSKYGFEDTLSAHLKQGFVISRPDVFAMFRPVIHNADVKLIINPRHTFVGNCDCWHVYVCAGNMSKLWELAPCELPWVSYERRNILHVRAFCTMLQKTYT